ncbi:hypothetical protein BURKHO8Y_10174 [Burkholderia sp. 8Y]|nr:hypothetical protein BURKHO8Y_10174 [Burkholderia sp. 8Y]
MLLHRLLCGVRRRDVVVLRATQRADALLIAWTSTKGLSAPKKTTPSEVRLAHLSEDGRARLTPLNSTATDQHKPPRVPLLAYAWPESRRIG